MANKQKTQAQMVLEYMQDGNTLTSLQALDLFGILSFPKRICELESDVYGRHKFERKTIVVVDRFGQEKRVFEYRLVG